jgi:hypothetical protein
MLYRIAYILGRRLGTARSLLSDLPRSTFCTKTSTGMVEIFDRFKDGSFKGGSGQEPVLMKLKATCRSRRSTMRL